MTSDDKRNAHQEIPFKNFENPIINQNPSKSVERLNSHVPNLADQRIPILTANLNSNPREGERMSNLSFIELII